MNLLRIGLEQSGARPLPSREPRTKGSTGAMAAPSITVTDAQDIRYYLDAHQTSLRNRRTAAGADSVLRELLRQDIVAIGRLKIGLGDGAEKTD